jgi:hypothetical protein
MLLANIQGLEYLKLGRWIVYVQMHITQTQDYEERFRKGSLALNIQTKRHTEQNSHANLIPKLC